MMHGFPVGDILPRKVSKVRRVSDPVYADSSLMISQHEFSMEVEKVGSFYACNGSEVEYTPAKGATRASLELYLNGSVYGAILHQRGILPLHGSSFAWHGSGIMLCGESGAGKSSLTAAFCMAGAEFLTDDVTPIVICDGKPFILPLSDCIKLWKDSLLQLNREKSGLTAICPGQEKYYFPMEKGNHRSFPLHRVFIIEVTEDEQIQENNGRNVDAGGTHTEIIGGKINSDITKATNNKTGTKAEGIAVATDYCSAETLKTGADGAMENSSAGAMKTGTSGATENCVAETKKNSLLNAKQKEAIYEQKIVISELGGIASFAALRNEVYRWEYLSAMPETEAGYLDKLLDISRSVEVARVRRPANMGIGEMRRFLECLLEK
jgi:hypothetical protein